MWRILEWAALAISAAQTTFLRFPGHLCFSILCLHPFGTCPRTCADPQMTSRLCPQKSQTLSLIWGNINFLLGASSHSYDSTIPSSEGTSSHSSCVWSLVSTWWCLGNSQNSLPLASCLICGHHCHAMCHKALTKAKQMWATHALKPRPPRSVS